MFEIGFPIGTRPSPAVTLCSVDQMVVSVGPYRFHKAWHFGSSRSANSRGSVSPPHNIFRSCASVHPGSSSRRHGI